MSRHGAPPVEISDLILMIWLGVSMPPWGMLHRSLLMLSGAGRLDPAVRLLGKRVDNPLAGNLDTALLQPALTVG
jgi:hypothetical protein